MRTRPQLTTCALSCPCIPDIPHACSANAYHVGTAAHTHERSQPALFTRRMLWSCSCTRSRERLRDGAVVLLHVVEKCCRLAERGSGAWARRVRACAVRGRSHGVVLCVTLRSSCSGHSWSARMACILACCRGRPGPTSMYVLLMSIGNTYSARRTRAARYGVTTGRCASYWYAIPVGQGRGYRN